jgi:ribokinase/sulfofructose kinase
MNARATPAAGGRPFDLVAVGDPVLDVVIHSAQLPRWDDKHLGRSMRQFAGGTEANAACAASRLGLRVAMFGGLGEGPAAEFLHRELLRFGVEDTWLSRRSEVSAATAIVYVSETGERAITYVPAGGVGDRSDELAAMLRRTRCVYTVPYDATGLQRLAAAARAAGTEVAVDVERAVAAVPGAWPALAECADLMFFNETGFAMVAGRAPTLATASALLRQTRARMLVVTQGVNGALAVDRHGRAVAQGAYEAKVVDTTGAGDSFNGAFLAACLQGADLRASLAQACAAACLCVEAPGARATTLGADSVAEVQRLRPIVNAPSNQEIRP